MIFGWKQRFYKQRQPLFLPRCLHSDWWDASLPSERPSWMLLFVCFALTYLLCLGVRLLELPFWSNDAYKHGNEFLLATHDAYHWIAGAEGFEFGVGHPMSEMLTLFSRIFDMSPANIGFWLPPFFGALLGGAVFLWACGIGYPFAGICAGVLASLSPAFLARTLLAFCDTDLTVLLFAVVLGLVPALWLHPWLNAPLDLFLGRIVFRKNRQDLSDNLGRQTSNMFLKLSWRSFVESCGSKLKQSAFTPALTPQCMERSMLSWPWLLALMASGIFGFWTQEWHSFFPYFIRYSALLIPTLIVVCGPVQGRMLLLRGALCHVLPLLMGGPGLLAALVYSLILHLPVASSLSSDDEGATPTVVNRLFLLIRKFGRDNRVLCLLWLLVAFLCFDSSVFELMRSSFTAYVKRGGDVAATSILTDPLVFPSVSESIIETQTISLRGLLVYYYPSEILALLSIIAVFVRFVKTPVIAWFFPLLVLFFMSRYMGGRMAMFGVPVLAFALCLEGSVVLSWLCHKMQLIVVGSFPAWGAAARFRWAQCHLGALALVLAVTVWLGWPLAMYIPNFSRNGPIISQEQAAALAFIKENTPPESIVWNWWDWGYATHHFSQRMTIADGARHGGASLYLPAAAYTTADPRFARQVIKYTALKSNAPGKVFAGLTAADAQKLMVELGNKNAPLIQAPGKQYIVVSYDTIAIGAWISRFGSWNFVKKSMQSALVSNIAGDIQFNPETGTLLSTVYDQYKGKNHQNVSHAGSMVLFSPKERKLYSYAPRIGNHLIFDLKNPEAIIAPDINEGPVARFWQWAQGDFQAIGPSSSVLLLDPIAYNTMMVQLLVNPADDPRFAPYFKCIFDNIYTRVYEVR